MKKLLSVLFCLLLLTSCALGQEEYEARDYVDENGNHIQVYYDPEYECWCQNIIYGQPNEEGCTVLDLKKMSGEMICSIWFSDFENGVRSRYYSYDDTGAMTNMLQYTDGQVTYAEIYENGEMVYYEKNDWNYNADGYRISYRYTADGALDHEWWWSPEDLYHEIWYLPGGAIDFMTYWYYGTPEADEIYEEYDGNGVLRQRHLYKYNENGELERIG